MTLYKWWPVGNRATFHINSLEQWERIKHTVDTKFASYLGWKTQSEVSQEIEEAIKDEEKGTETIARVTKKAGIVQKIIRGLDFSKVDLEDYDELVAIIGDLTSAATNADKTLYNTYRKLFRELRRAPARAVGELSTLLGSWSLAQLTQITREVTHRLETLRLFRERVLDDGTYEIRGDNSIHRVLERAMWLIDERYWLMHSNRTLREIVGKELERRDSAFKKQRPDFVCGTVEGKLIVVELKRPSHSLTIEDLNQLETYVDILEKHSGHSVGEALLMGRQVTDELERKKKYRGHQFKVRNYADLIDETEHRYSSYLASDSQ